MEVSKTLVNSARLVSQRHVNPLGTLYGGYLLEWLIDSGTIAAINFAKGNVVLGFLDKTHFISPVKAGDVLLFKSWVVGTRRSSLSVLVETYVLRNGHVSLATVGKMIFVKVDSEGRPVPIDREVLCDVEWEGLCRHFQQWRLEVDRVIEDGEIVSHSRSVSSFVAMPEDSLDGVLMYAGRLMFKLDELAFIEAFRFKPAIYVTAGVYKIVFKKPIHVGDVVDIKTAISYVGNTSLDVEFFVEAGGFRERRAVAHGFFTFVNMTEGKPTPIGVAIPVDEAAKKRREESVQEAKLLKNLKPPADFDKPWTLQLYRSPS